VERRHLTLISFGVGTFVLASSLAYALDLNRTSEVTGTSSAVLPQAVAAASASTTEATAAATDPAQVPGVVGYLNSGALAVTYLTWQVDSAGTLSGTLDSAAVTGTAPSEAVIPHVNQPVFGQVRGSTISLQVDGHADTGTFAGGTLTLNVIQQDGSIAAVRFTSATPAQYNAALASLRSSVDGDNGQAQTAADTQAAINRLGRDYTALGNDQSSLVLDVGQMDRELYTTSKDLSGEKAAAAQVVSEVSQGTDVNTVCSDAYAVASDGYSVQSDSYSVSSDLDSVTSDLTELRAMLPQVQSDLETVQAAESMYTGSGGAPSPQDVASELTSANSVAMAQVAKANARIDTVNGYVTTAQTYSAKAARAGSCSAPSPAPTPIPHIS
jgi:hypothetical protein